MRTLEKSFGENVWSTACAIVTITNANNGGTFKIFPDGTYETYKPTSGYIVGIHGFTVNKSEFNQGNNSGLLDAIKNASETEQLLGTWIDGENVDIDTVMHFDGHVEILKSILSIAKNANQKAIFDCANNCVIDL